LVDKARDNHHLIINVAGGNAIRLLPPLNMSADETIQIGESIISLIQSAM
jgi:acetylornithine aminotransferase